ncbi:hypothetical protein, partial [Agathobacter rectalis]|uniref:hypothetical protein n=1 Tax=Agathobacter rectalis TaxID=39491 RepID=UPI0027D20611
MNGHRVFVNNLYAFNVVNALDTAKIRVGTVKVHKSEPLSENAPFMHRKYMPISAINTPIHILAPHFLLRK